jgi:hypothetical protein
MHCQAHLLLLLLLQGRLLLHVRGQQLEDAAAVDA